MTTPAESRSKQVEPLSASDAAYCATMLRNASGDTPLLAACLDEIAFGRHVVVPAPSPIPRATLEALRQIAAEVRQMGRVALSPALDDIAERIELLATVPEAQRVAHSKTEYKRLTAQGVDVLPPEAQSGKVEK